MKASRLLLADDHILFVEALRALLATRYDIIGAVDNGRALQESAQKLRPDGIITDVTMPVMNGLEAIRQLRDGINPPRVIFLTMHDDSDLALECFRCGAAAFVTKDRIYSELIDVIDAVFENQSRSSPVMMTTVGTTETTVENMNTSVESLTSRQRHILQLFAEGKTMKEIATIMNLSTRTIEWHKYRIMRVLKAKNTADLVGHAVRLKLVL